MPSFKSLTPFNDDLPVQVPGLDHYKCYDASYTLSASGAPIQKFTKIPAAGAILLTDQFGDIHADSRGLGLYLGDTRILSCLVLRISGHRPVLLQGSMGGNYRGTIYLTNPSIDRNPKAKMGSGDSLASRKLGISRDRLLSNDVLQERLVLLANRDPIDAVQSRIVEEVAHLPP